MKADIKALTKHVPLELQDGLAVVVKNCPQCNITVDFTDPALCRVVISVALDKKLSKKELLEIERAISGISLAEGKPVQNSEQIKPIDRVTYLAAIIGEQWGNLIRAEGWVKDGKSPIPAESLVELERSELDESLAEMKQLDKELYKSISIDPRLKKGWKH